MIRLLCALVDKGNTITTCHLKAVSGMVVSE